MFLSFVLAVMASPGLLFLLLVSSSLLLSTMSGKMNQQTGLTTQSKHKERVLKVVENVDKIRFALTPFLSYIPVYGQLIKLIVDAVLVGVSLANKNSVLDTLKSEFESLNKKLDDYHIEQKWDIWAAGAFHKPERNIRKAWADYQLLTRSIVKSNDDNEKKSLKEKMAESCKKCESAMKDLHQYLTAKGTTTIANLGEQLAVHVKCHENDIRGYTELINRLMSMANTVIKTCNRIKEINSKDISDYFDNMAYESASELFKIHIDCILKGDEYIQNDVQELISGTKDFQKLADDIRSFLVKTYYRYDWMVVAFEKKKSGHEHIKFHNRHTRSRFLEVTKDEITVAVARQVKGTHNKEIRLKVQRAIGNCFQKQVECHKVADQLSDCKELVPGIGKVSDTYSAVHAYKHIDKAHDSYNAEEAPSDPKVPYIYKGQCQKVVGTGQFVVLIKSDVDIVTKDPCSTLKCDPKRGTCISLKDPLVAMCQCIQPYYGPTCGDNFMILAVDRRRNRS